MRMTKSSGIAAFKQIPEPIRPVPKAIDAPKVKRRKRGQNDRVSSTVKFTKDDWMRVRQFAMDEDLSLQELAIKGISRLFIEKGLPGLDT